MKITSFIGGNNFVNYMSEKKNVALDMHHYQGFGSYWNSLALDIPQAWKSHYEHTCRVSANQYLNLDLFVCLFEWTLSGRKEVGIPLGILPHVWEQNKRTYFPTLGQS